MNFQELEIEIKEEYRSLQDDIVKEFYYPLLRAAQKYQRAVGFFSSSALIEISKGITGLIQNGGAIELIASPKLSQEDVEAIEKGMALREEIIAARLNDSIEVPKNEQEEKRLNLLINLIAQGKLTIKIAVLEKNKRLGIYHEKMGLLTDCEGNVVAFSGSMNESNTAFEHNYESIDVYKSWNGGSDAKRVLNKQLAFQSMWNNRQPWMEVLEFPEASRRKLFQYRKNEEIDYSLDKELEQSENSSVERKKQFHLPEPKIPEWLEIREYQREAIAQWKEQKYRGIFDMATGTGKTYTGLAAICRLYDDLQGNLAVVIICPFQHLVEQWLEDLEVFSIRPIVAYSAPKYKDYLPKLRKEVFEYNLQSRRFISLITTLDTFSSDKVQEQLRKIRKNLLLVVDEAHNMGAGSYRRLLDEKYTYRLALSATFDRHNDVEGTEELYDFFGKKCIEYSLEQAMKEGMLTKYNYYPIPVYLSEDELEKYNRISAEIAKNVMLDKKGKAKLNEKGKKLAIKRAGIAAGAINKIQLLVDTIQDYKKENHILIYCGAAKIHEGGFDGGIENDIRQIDKITQKLGLEVGMKVAQFTSRENAAQRNILKKEFAAGDELQALVAIKCLDEGVNIPAIKTAFILASTTNPKEYIQRRGRVLRLSPGKEIADIYDFVTLPRNLSLVPYLSKEEMKYDKALVKNELSRVLEFQRLAENSYDSTELIFKIKDAYGLYETEDKEAEGGIADGNK